jgi:putative N6-adenine-specific DNA methylase
VNRVSRGFPTPPVYDAFAVAAPGLEELTAAELAGLGVGDPRVVDGGVEFKASPRTLFEANLHLRTASRVLIRLAQFRALSFAELERRARRIPWEKVLSRGERVTLRVTCRKSRLYHSGAVAERIERDLADRMGAVPVRTTANDESAGDPKSDDAQLIVVRIDHDQCTVSADSSGAHLHQRGYRTSVTAAPMRETLAAALLLATGWNRRMPLIDPFCGSGTIPIEAALIAAGIAPGRHRGFRLMNWPGHDQAEWQRVHSAALRREKADSMPAIRGSDRSAAAIRAATENAERAGVTALVHFEKRDALRVEPDAPSGWVVSNPPYGVRLGDAGETRRLLARFGDRLRERFDGWQIGLLAPAQAERVLGIPLESKFRTTNGGLRVRFLVGVIPALPASLATEYDAWP